MLQVKQATEIQYYNKNECAKRRRNWYYATLVWEYMLLYGTQLTGLVDFIN